MWCAEMHGAIVHVCRSGRRKFQRRSILMVKFLAAKGPVWTVASHDVEQPCQHRICLKPWDGLRYPGECYFFPGDGGWSSSTAASPEAICRAGIVVAHSVDVA